MCQSSFLQALFDSLAGTWSLDRDLASANAQEPSGKCLGRAMLTARAPSTVVDQDGKLQTADGEMLYHESGDFHLPNQVKMPFSKKYIWRFNKDAAKISVWFCKPGTEQVDYLFHNIDLVLNEKKSEASGTGGHLCIDDFYSTSYAFNLSSLGEAAVVQSWETTHEVQGPKKDQTLTTRFAKA
jgi:hypothetical protein